MSGVQQTMLGGGSRYSIALLAGDGATSTSATPNGTAEACVGASGHIYVVSTQTNLAAAGFDAIGIAKLTPSGVLVWGRKLAPPAAYDHAYSTTLHVDAAENVYVCAGGADTDGVALEAGYVVKYNSSGTLQWQRKITSTSDVYTYEIAVDSSGNVFVAGYGTSAGLIVKYNSSGVLQWQKKIDSSSLSAIEVDASGNIYAASRNGNYGNIFKLSSAGAMTWQKQLSGSLTATYDIRVDGSGNTYTLSDANAVDKCLTKLDSSGVLQWSKRIDHADDLNNGEVSIGADGYIYVGTATWAATSRSVVWCLDSSGNEIYKRGLATCMTGRKVTQANGMMTFATVNANAYTVVCQLPSDGSREGIYVVDGVSHTYAALTATVTDSGYTVANGTRTVSGGSVTDAAGDLTDSAYSPNITVLTL